MEVSEKGGNSSIRVTSTMPVLCDHNYTDSCCIHFLVDVDGPRSEYRSPSARAPRKQQAEASFSPSPSSPSPSPSPSSQVLTFCEHENKFELGVAEYFKQRKSSII